MLHRAVRCASASTRFAKPLVLTTSLFAGCFAQVGEPEDLDVDVGVQTQPSICGTTTDWQEVELYDGSLGPSRAFVAAHQTPVGHLNPIGCSGTLIAANLFLTAGHCVDTDILSQKVWFNYQHDSTGVLRTVDEVPVVRVVEQWLGGLDYAVLELSGTPGARWGIATISGFPARSSEAITLIQHPNTAPKVVDGGTLGFAVDGSMTYADIDTLPGASGSGILQNRTGDIIGVHTHGAVRRRCTATDPNGGEAVMDILELGQSTVVRQRAMDASKWVALSMI